MSEVTINEGADPSAIAARVHEQQMEWAPDTHRYIRLANIFLASFVGVLIFAAGFLAALIWKGIG